MSGVDRERGYIDRWNPQPKTRELLENVEDVLDEYRDRLPMTLRQVYYRLVGRNLIEKTDGAYESLGRALRLARRARMIPWRSISDPDADALWLPSRDVRDVDDFWPDVEDDARSWSRWPAEGQPRLVVVWTEAAGTVAQLQSAIRDLPGVVLTGGGQSSVTVNKRLADLVLAERVPVVLLHVGDYDPDGQVIYDTLAEDVAAFVEADRRHSRQGFTPVRLALTPEQVMDPANGVVTQPLKIPAGEGQVARARRERIRPWREAQPPEIQDRTAQLEALTPDALAAIVRNAVSALVDHDRLAQARKDGKIEREKLVRAVQEARQRLADE